MIVDRNSRTRKKVRIIILKDFAIKKLDDPLKSVILAEKDEMSAEEFIAKVPTWLNLLHVQMSEKQ